MRDKILACACNLYLTDGLDGFSMRKLASAVGVTAPALYRHYESKERVLQDVVGEGYRHLIEYLHRALQARTPQDRFRLAGEGYLDFALEHPRYYEVLFSGTELLNDTPEDVAAQGCAVAQFWNDRVREAMGARILAPGDPGAIGMTSWAHAHGLISLYLKGMLPVAEHEFRALYRDSAARMFVGLGAKQFADQLEQRGGMPARATASAKDRT